MKGISICIECKKFILQVLIIFTVTSVNGQVELGQISGASLFNHPMGVFVSGNYAYVVNVDGNSLEIVDISNPALPIHAGRIVDGAGGAQLKGPMSVYVVDNFAYIASSGSNALEVIDVATPASPVHKGSITDGTGGAHLAFATSVYVSGNYAYVVDGNGLEIIDISNPASPTHKGSILNGAGGATFFAASSVCVSGDFAYVVNNGPNINNINHGSLEIVDISNPIAPTHKGSVSDGDGGALLGGANSVFVSGNFAYVASSSSNALEIIDISNPATPLHKGSFSNNSSGNSTLNSPSSVFVVGNTAFVANSGSTVVCSIDVTNPALPVLKTSMIVGDSHSIYAVGTVAYVACYLSSYLEIVQLLPVPVLFFTSPTSLDYGTTMILSTSTGGSTGAVTYSVINGTGGATIANGNQLTGTGIGTVTVKASIAADANYAATSALRVVTINKATPTLVFASQDAVTYNSSISLSVNTGGSTGAVTYSVVNGTGSATITNGNQLSATGAGTVTVTASIAADANYNSTSVAQTVTINKADQMITFNPLSSMCPNTSVGLSATSSSGLPVSYASSSSWIAQPSGNTLYSLHAAGTATITASQAGNTNYNPASASQSVTVIPAAAITTQPSTTSQSVCLNGTVTPLSVTATGTNLTYQWHYNTGSPSVPDGPPIPGATSSTYTPSSAAVGTFRYYVVVSGTCGTVTSDVSGPIQVKTIIPNISVQPSTVSSTACPNATLSSLSVTAQGTGPFTYQWYDSTANSNSAGIPISGATSSTYTPSSAVAGTSYYNVIVTSTATCGVSATSNFSGPITITPPTIIVSPPSAAGQTICKNGIVTPLQVTAAGTGTLTYRWYQNNISDNTTGSAISGALSSSYTPLSTSTGTNFYYALVTGTCGQAISAVSGAINIITAPGSAHISASNGTNICTNNVVLMASPAGSVYSYNWSDGETGQSIYPKSQGSYTVTVSNICGSSTSTAISLTRQPSNCTVARLGAEILEPNATPQEQAEHPDVAAVTIYPNPASDEATLAVPSVSKVDRQVWVYDMFGKVQASSILKKGEWKIAISTKGMTDGVYIINIENGFLFYTTKMMVVHK